MNKMTKVFEGNAFEGHEVRIVGTSKNIMFVLRDVCDVLEIQHTQSVVQRYKDDDVFSKYTIRDLFGRSQEMTVVNEEGLYEILFDSRKPEAKRFRKWVTRDVLPTIRKTGGYQVQPKSELELIQMTATEIIKTNERIDVIEDKLNNKMTIDYGQQLAIENAKKKRVEYLWARMQEEGGSELYDTKRKVYGRIGSDLKKVFAVPSYRNIKDADFFEVMNYIAAWRPVLV